MAAQSSNTWHDRLIYEPEVTVVVALFDGRNAPIPHSVGIYDESWVDKLYRGVARNYKGYFDFVCLTDRNYIFSENIKQIRFDRSVDQYGWMSLMEWYHPKVCNTRRVTMGIDTIITGPLDDIFNCDLEDYKLGVCQDPIFPDDICNAMTIAEPSFCKEFWDYWIENEKIIMRDDEIFAVAAGSPSEMVLLRSLYSDSPRLDTIFPGRILSYKAHIRDHWHRVADASIIYFHGTPKPHQVNEKWVRENWV
jgi:hypothetical protein